MLTTDFNSFSPGRRTERWHEGDSYVHWYAGVYSSDLEDFKKRRDKKAGHSRGELLGGRSGER